MSVYTPPSNEYVARQAIYMQEAFIDFVNRHKTDFIADVKIDISALSDCILRVHQRKHYFETFHYMPKGLSEVKVISLYCFWLLRYKPFILFFNEQNLPERDIRRKKYFLESFCLFWFTFALRHLYKKRGLNKLPLSEKGITDLLYSLKYHDISKEALTEIFELLEDVIGHSF